MSAKAFETLISRAMREPEFADLLIACPEKALADYDLSASEISDVLGMDRDDFEQYVTAAPEEHKPLGLQLREGWYIHSENILLAR